MMIFRRAHSSPDDLGGMAFCLRVLVLHPGITLGNDPEWFKTTRWGQYTGVFPGCNTKPLDFGAKKNLRSWNMASLANFGTRIAKRMRTDTDFWPYRMYRISTKTTGESGDLLDAAVGEP